MYYQMTKTPVGAHNDKRTPFSVMAEVPRPTINAVYKRQEQLKRWLDSETNREPEDLRRKQSRIKFHDGCVFLAACSAGDIQEVDRLLAKGADINTTNVDGLTALHQVGSVIVLLFVFVLNLNTLYNTGIFDAN